jgi:biotin carboxyl carrier protein
MRKFMINVNGKSYEVEVEEIGGATTQPQKATPVAAPAAKAAAAAPAPAKVDTPAGATNVVAPMPGNIWKLLVEVGDTVTEGQAIIILEAMKMENDIVAPKAGKVVGINVKQGESVDTGTVLISIA